MQTDKATKEQAAPRRFGKTQATRVAVSLDRPRDWEDPRYSASRDRLLLRLQKKQQGARKDVETKLEEEQVLSESNRDPSDHGKRDWAGEFYERLLDMGGRDTAYQALQLALVAEPPDPEEVLRLFREADKRKGAIDLMAASELSQADIRRMRQGKHLSRVRIRQVAEAMRKAATDRALEELKKPEDFTLPIELL